jgi:YHYH protein
MLQSIGKAIAIIFLVVLLIQISFQQTISVARNSQDPIQSIVNLSHIPIGDGKISDAPVRGSVWSCRKRFRQNVGAHAQGDWIKSDGTYDFLAKPIVDGKVLFPHAFQIKTMGNERLILSNDFPNHPTGRFPISPQDDAYQYDRNPHKITEREFRLALPKDPEVAEEASCVRMGAIGVLLSGGAVFNALDARGEDAVAHEIQDACQGHPERNGTYHYHSLTTCLEKIDKAPSTQHSALVGYAIDGFGIYGRRGERGKQLTNADLDECHGHTHSIVWDGKKRNLYHYHATWEYPYTVGCFRATPIQLSRR